MRIVVAGGTGFLGSRLAGRLAAEGHEVLVLKRPSSSASRLNDIPQRIGIIETDGRGILIPAGMDAVINAACCYGRGGETPQAILEANVSFPLSLLMAAAAAGVPRFLQAGSVLPATLSLYALTKQHFAEWGSSLADRLGIIFLHLRMEQFYGLGSGPDNFITGVIRKCLAGVPLELTAGVQKRDFIHVDDVLNAFATLLITEASVGFHTFDVGTGNPETVRSVVERIHKLTESSSTLLFGAIPYRPDEPMALPLDIDPMRTLGWAAKISLEQGLTDVVRAEARLWEERKETI